MCKDIETTEKKALEHSEETTWAGQTYEPAVDILESEQAMVLLNRRGYAAFLVCRERTRPQCGHSAVTVLPPGWLILRVRDRLACLDQEGGA